MRPTERIKSTEKVSDKRVMEKALDYLESNTAGAITAKVILATIAVGGIICVGAVAPNLFRAIEGTCRTKAPSKKMPINRSSALATFSKLKKDGYVYLEEQKNGSICVRLTEKGKQRVYDFSRKSIQKPLVWDKKWRVVIFDIDSKKAQAREMFRQGIKEMGFVQIQKSVWAHPYKCEDEVLFLAKQLRIVKSVEIFTVQKMIHQKALHTRFFRREYSCRD